ncbi:hypothetical protein H7J86_33040 [Mycobacterium hackensackense]|nr:hypothetical protein [Mycobacterium hackensackense]
MRTVTEARNGFHALLDDATHGVSTHVIQGAKVRAHIVPANAPVVDPVLMNEMLAAFITEQAAAIASSSDAKEGTSWTAPDVVGRMFSWTWLTDPALFDNAVSAFREALREQTGRSIDLGEIWEGLSPGLTAHLSDSDIPQLRAHLRLA